MILKKCQSPHTFNIKSYRSKKLMADLITSDTKETITFCRVFGRPVNLPDNRQVKQRALLNKMSGKLTLLFTAVFWGHVFFHVHYLLLNCLG